MGQVAVTINGRSYRFDCGDGEEARLGELAAYVKERVEQLGRDFGKAGEDRLILMAALLIADELWDARAARAGPAENAASEEEASAGRREQEAIRAEHRRRAAVGDV